MIDLNYLKKIKRINTDDKRNFKFGLRADRNEKIENWPINIFKNIFKNIKPHEFTAYYNTREIKKLKVKISKYLKISGENFIINHGGDGVIKEFLLLNHKKNLKVMVNGNNYEMYKVYFKALKIKCFEIPYQSHLNSENIFSLDKQFLKKNIKKVDIVFITNPNQISDKDFSIKELKELCINNPKKSFFIDESYYDFGHYSFIQLTRKYKNIFIMRSITKTFGLASARVGFLIAHPQTIKSFKALETPYPVSLFSGKCLEFFLEKINLIKEYNKKVKIGRKFIVRELKKIKYKVHDSNGVSVFVYFKNEKAMKKKYKYLLSKLIYTRAMKINDLNFLRISCGPEKQMRKILKHFSI